MQNKQIIESPDFISFDKTQEFFNDIVIHLDEDIREPKYYRYLFSELEGLTENCTVRIRINTHGGYLEGAFAFLEAIQNTRATVYAHIVGACHSAGSLIALSCPYISVGKNASMMIHAPSYGTIGKTGEIINQTLHSTSQHEALFKDVYKDFLSESEIKDVLKGNDIWLNAEEISKRLENKFNPKKPRVKRAKAVPEGQAKKAVKAPSKETVSSDKVSVEETM